MYETRDACVCPRVGHRGASGRIDGNGLGRSEYAERGADLEQRKGLIRQERIARNHTMVVFAFADGRKGEFQKDFTERIPARKGREV